MVPEFALLRHHFEIASRLGCIPVRFQSPALGLDVVLAMPTRVEQEKWQKMYGPDEPELLPGPWIRAQRAFHRDLSGYGFELRGHQFRPTPDRLETQKRQIQHGRPESAPPILVIPSIDPRGFEISLGKVFFLG